MNTANKLTMLRVALIPVFLILLYLRFPFHMYFALTVFILASVTDFVDGYIARHYNQVTDFGKFMDPLADKVLVMAALLWFVEAGRLPAWVLLVVIVREFAVTALRLIAVERGRVIAAAWSGKVKDGLHHGVHRAHVPAHPGGAEPGLCGGDRAHNHLLRRGVFCQEPGRDLGDQVKSVQAGPYKRPCPFSHKNFRNCAAFSPRNPV